MYWSLVLALTAATPVKPSKVLSFDIAKHEAPEDINGLHQRDAVINDYGSILNQPCYLLDLELGTPPRSVKLWMDTGSAYMWVRQEAFNYTESSTAEKGDTFGISYLAGSVSGFWVTDKAALSTGWEFDYNFGQVDAEGYWANFDGLLGLSPISLESDTRNSSIINSLYRNQHINSRTFGLWMGRQGNGSIAFGGYDSSRYTGDLTVVPFWPDEGGFGLPISKFYGYDHEDNQILLAEGGIKCAIDTGAGSFNVPQAVYDAILNAFNVTEAKNAPDALKKGFPGDYLVAQYKSNTGLSIDAAGLVLDIPMDHWLNDVYGNTLTGEGTIGEWYAFGLKAADFCLLGNHQMFHNYYVVADYDHSEFAIAPAVQQSDYTGGTALHTIGPEGFSGFKSAPSFAETTEAPFTGYTTYFPGDPRATATTASA